jgi:hypothetical protein
MDSVFPKIKILVLAIGGLSELGGELQFLAVFERRVEKPFK